MCQADEVAVLLDEDGFGLSYPGPDAPGAGPERAKLHGAGRFPGGDVAMCRCVKRVNPGPVTAGGTAVFRPVVRFSRVLSNRAVCVGELLRGLGLPT